MGALREGLSSCRLLGCQKYFRKCLVMIGTGGRSSTTPGCSSGSSFAAVQRRRRRTSASSASNDVISSRCPQSHCRCCRSLCTKTILVLVNFAFLVCGWALVAFGIWMHINREGFFVSHLLRDNPTNPLFVYDRIPFALITIGLFIAGTSFMGCCGACAESVCFLSFYSLLVFSTVALEIVICVVAAKYRQEVSSRMFTSLSYQIRWEYNRSSLRADLCETDVASLTNAWDVLQSTLGCCGVVGPQDYIDSSWYNNTPVTEGSFVPLSCCVQRFDQNEKTEVLNQHYCQVEAVVAPKNNSDILGFLHRLGCRSVLTSWFQEYEHALVVFLSSLVLVQFLDFVLSCALITWIRRKHSEYWWCEDEEFE